MFKNLFFIVFLLANVAVAQQPTSTKIGKIVGKTFDASTNQVLGFASVSVFITQNAKDSLVGGVVVSETGEFIINNLPTGTYVLLLRKDGEFSSASFVVGE